MPKRYPAKVDYGVLKGHLNSGEFGVVRTTACSTASLSLLQAVRTRLSRMQVSVLRALCMIGGSLSVRDPDSTHKASGPASSKLFPADPSIESQGNNPIRRSYVAFLFTENDRFRRLTIGCGGG